MIHLVASSDGLKGSALPAVVRLTDLLGERGFDVTRSRNLIAPAPGEPASPASERAEEINRARIEGRLVIDLSGGNRANEILPDLRIGPGPAIMGYSDLTAVLLAYAPQRPTIWFQAGHILAGGPTADFLALLAGTSQALLEPRVRHAAGPRAQVEGRLLGGNTRCLLKLAGTPYFPDLDGHILLLEGRTSDPATLIPQLAQLRQMGAFERPSALVLGTFTTFEAEHSTGELIELVRSATAPHLPIYRTEDIGHAKTAGGAALGAHYRLGDDMKLVETVNLWS